MNAATVTRLISLIPDRMTRTQTGSLFHNGAHCERIELLRRYLNWLGPLNPLGQEEQQFLGLRAPSARPLTEGEEGADAEDAEEDAGADAIAPAAEEPPVRLPGAGTQIAA